MLLQVLQAILHKSVHPHSRGIRALQASSPISLRNPCYCHGTMLLYLPICTLRPGIDVVHAALLSYARTTECPVLTYGVCAYQELKPEELPLWRSSSLEDLENQVSQPLSQIKDQPSFSLPRDFRT